MNSPRIVPAGAVGRDGTEIVQHDPVLANVVDQPQTDDEAQAKGPTARWTFWSRQVQAALTHERRWRNEAVACETAYFGEDKDQGAREGQEKTMSPINDEVALIHSNIEVLKPLIYSDTPQPVVRRRWRGDGKSDETDLMAAEAGQRLAVYMLDTEDFDGAMVATRDDWLIAGRGQTRVVYKAATGKALERVCPRNVPWPRFLIAPAASWDAAPWAAFEVPMTRSRIAKRWPDKAEQFSFNTPGLVDKAYGITDDDRNRGGFAQLNDESGQPVASPFDTAMVWEIWNREEGKIIWWSPSFKGDVIEETDDFLGLENFFPCPKPLIATTKTESLNPRPDIRYYQRRAKEIEKATRKLESLLDVISVSALVPAAAVDELKKILKGENIIVAVADWVGLMEKGGLTGIVQWLPIQAIVAAAQALITIREQNRQAMFEASGVSDIMRAQGDPDETATAQQIKGRYAGLRLSDRQRTMANHALDVLRLMVEIAVEHFDTATIAEICALDMPMSEMERATIIQQIETAEAIFARQVALRQEAIALAQEAQQAGQSAPIDPGPEPKKPDLPKRPATSWELVHARLRNDISRKITISIETQSTILADEQADKDSRIEFISAFATFVKELLPLVGTGQFDLKTVKELLLFGVRGFPKSRTLETMIASLPEEMATPQQQEDVSVTVAKIRAEADAMIKKMDGEERQKDRQLEISLKGVDLIEKATDKASPSPEKPDLPQPPKPEK